MSDISTASAPPPADPSQAGDAPRYDPPAGDRRGDAFQAALRQADGRTDDESLRADGNDEDEDDQDGDDRRRGGQSGAALQGDGGLLGLFGRSRLQDASDPNAGLAALTSGPGGHPGAGEADGPAAAGGPDLQVFAQMLEDAAARAQTAPPGQAIQVTLNDARAPLEGVAVARLPDGSLSMTLQASPGAVAEVTRTLETLRRRLEAKGVTLGELKLAEEGEAGAPAVQGADGT